MHVCNLCLTNSTVFQPKRVDKTEMITSVYSKGGAWSLEISMNLANSRNRSNQTKLTGQRNPLDWIQQEFTQPHIAQQIPNKLEYRSREQRAGETKHRRRRWYSNPASWSLKPKSHCKYFHIIEKINSQN